MIILYTDITYLFHLAVHESPVQCPARVLVQPVPFDQPPFLRLLRHLYVDVVRRLRRYYGAVRLPVLVHRQITPLGFLTRPRPIVKHEGKHWLSRFSRRLFLYSLRVSDRAGPIRLLRYQDDRYCLPRPSRVSAPGVNSISRLNTWLAHTFVNASRLTLRPTAHDSRSAWFATPLLYDSFIRNNLPVYPGAIRRPESRGPTKTASFRLDSRLRSAKGRIRRGEHSGMTTLLAIMTQSRRPG